MAAWPATRSHWLPSPSGYPPTGVSALVLAVGTIHIARFDAITDPLMASRRGRTRFRRRKPWVLLGTPLMDRGLFTICSGSIGFTISTLFNALFLGSSYHRAQGRALPTITNEVGSQPRELLVWWV